MGFAVIGIDRNQDPRRSRQTGKAEAAQTAGCSAHRSLHHLLRLSVCVLKSRDYGVLERLNVLRVDELRIDRDALHFLVPRHDDSHRPAAGAALDGLAPQLFLGLHHVRLHLLELLEHLRVEHARSPSDSQQKGALPRPSSGSTPSEYYRFLLFYQELALPSCRTWYSRSRSTASSTKPSSSCTVPEPRIDSTSLLVVRTTRAR